MMKIFCAFDLCCCLFFSLGIILGTLDFTFAKGSKYFPPASDRVKMNIDLDWKFLRGDVSGEEETHQVNELPWQKVNLPHEWSIEGPYLQQQNTTQGFMPQEIGWYRKQIYLPQGYEDRKIFIIFDGVYRSSDVWMNYAYLGHHESGYTSFIIDMTDYVRIGNRTPNGLRVRVDARRHEEDMYEGCGIYRHVWLLITNKLHIKYWGTFVSTPHISDSNASVSIKTRVMNEYPVAKTCKLTSRIVDAQGIIVAEAVSQRVIPGESEFEFTQSAEIKQPHLWNLDDPYLYRIFQTLEDQEAVVDSDEISFGIRTIQFDANKGFFLNGKHVKLKGFNAHYDFAGLGTALPDRIHWNAMMAMKQAGFNFYRSSHNPATPERLDVCDRIGMLVWDEIERKLESPEIELPLVEETITQHRNHPSIILWSLENESPLEGTTFGTRILKAATELAHKLDPTRPTTFAASMPVDKKGYGDAVDVVSYNYHWERSDKDHLANPHWKIGGLSEYSAARARRGVYGIEHFRRAENDSYFDLYNGMVQNMYELCTRVEQYWRRIKAREYMAGGCLWSGIDAWGEGNVWPLVSRGDGALDLCFFPKDAYYYFVSQWTEAPMVHLFPHWNWEGREGEQIDVWCYSNCEQVELFLNGRSRGSLAHHAEPAAWRPEGNNDIAPEKSETAPEHFAWKVPYEPGSLRVVGMRDGRVRCQTEIHTAGKPDRIELTRMMAQYVPEDQIPPLVADGRDIVVIKAAVVDELGNLVPDADHLIRFDIAGEGQIIGVGNGDIASHEANKASSRKAYNGLAAAIIQTTPMPGNIQVKADASGLKSGKMTIQSFAPKPAQVVVVGKRTTHSDKEPTSSVTAEIRDAFGTVVPFAENSVTFEIKGAASFSDGNKVLVVKASAGIASAEFKSLEQAYQVTVVAHSEGLFSGKVTLLVK
ncbi:DUF4982 domain-containing protein [candidate division KSB1 bacterium]|nr:DUF4982 domain-containing protein [candidate division KSB1 bacterium]